MKGNIEPNNAIRLMEGAIFGENTEPHSCTNATGLKQEPLTEEKLRAALEKLTSHEEASKEYLIRLLGSMGFQITAIPECDKATVVLPDCYIDALVRVKEGLI